MHGYRQSIKQCTKSVDFSFQHLLNWQTFVELVHVNNLGCSQKQTSAICWNRIFNKLEISHKLSFLKQHIIISFKSQLTLHIINNIPCTENDWEKCYHTHNIKL